MRVGQRAALLLLMLVQAGRPSPADDATVRCDFATVEDAGNMTDKEFASLRAAQKPLLLKGATTHWGARSLWKHVAELEKRLGSTLLPLQEQELIARGEAFRQPAGFTTLSGWRAHGGGSVNVIIFDANVSAGILPQLVPDLRPMPQPLLTVMRFPIFSLGAAAPQNGPAKQIDIDGGGLAFHNHDENWLALVQGRKQWFVQPAARAEPPASAYQRIPASTLQHEADDSSSAMQQCTQVAGDIVYLPTSWWHATYNLPQHPADGGDGWVVGIGGMGDSTIGSGAVVLGDLELLEALWKVEGPNLLVRANVHGESAFHRAATPTILHWLQQHGVDLSVPTAGQGTALIHLAAMQGNVDVMAWLLEQEKEGNEAAQQQLLRRPTVATGQEPVHYAAAGRSLRALRWLVAHGADLAAPARNGQTPFHLAASAGDEVVLTWLLGEQTSGGVDINHPRNDGATAAHFAASTAHVYGSRVLRWLAAHGCDMIAQMTAASGGQRPIDIVLASNNGSKESEEALKWLRAWDQDADEL